MVAKASIGFTATTNVAPFLVYVALFVSRPSAGCGGIFTVQLRVSRSGRLPPAACLAADVVAGYDPLSAYGTVVEPRHAGAACEYVSALEANRPWLALAYYALPTLLIVLIVL